ncbi:hypothetical protein COY95_04280 [Candidatus Woesearchaeota archaeon CG_4_10_14_0_8_um_filter_47_5]|nr:MAG: hypothetical protein COY95_04280 [Candidatus Woesearchaeota archaeon CG_4_10_14_0_8_um_filter_47_5]
MEHFAGKFPLWISPVQVKLITVADRFLPYAQQVREHLEESGIRTELDDRAESVSKKVRDAQMEKVPLILTIGEKEEQTKTVAVRTRDGTVKFGMEAKELVKKIAENVKQQNQDFVL